MTRCPRWDVATSFKRVELNTLTPYSGKVSGFHIRKPRLNLDLHCFIIKGQWKTVNKVMAEQLQLGKGLSYKTKFLTNGGHS